MIRTPDNRVMGHGIHCFEIVVGNWTNFDCEIVVVAESSETAVEEVNSFVIEQLMAKRLFVLEDTYWRTGLLIEDSLSAEYSPMNSMGYLEQDRF